MPDFLSLVTCKRAEAQLRPSPFPVGSPVVDLSGCAFSGEIREEVRLILEPRKRRPFFWSGRSMVGVDRMMGMVRDTRFLHHDSLSRGRREG